MIFESVGLLKELIEKAATRWSKKKTDYPSAFMLAMARILN